jgi:hypothetical protein
MEWIINIGLALLLFGLALGASEMAARVWIRRFSRRYPFVPGSRQHFQLDLKTLPNMAGETRFEVSADGVRTEAGRRPQRGAGRVLLAGGSCAEGYLLDWPSSVAGIMERDLNRPEVLTEWGVPSVHVGSVARSRTGAYATNLILRDLLPRYGQLEAIVLMVGATDLVDWMEIGSPNPYTPKIPTEQETFPVARTIPFGWRPKQTALYQCVRRLRERWMRPISRREQVGSRIGKVRSMRAAAQEIIDAVADPEPMLRNFEHHLRMAFEVAQKHAKRVVLARQPCYWKASYEPSETAMFWDSSVGNPYHEHTTRYYAHGLVARLMEQTNDRASALAMSMGIPVLDFMPHLPRTTTHYYDFYHFTPAGAQVVGDLITRKLLDRDLPAPLYTADQDQCPISRPLPGTGVAAPAR